MNKPKMNKPKVKLKGVSQSVLNLLNSGFIDNPNQSKITEYQLPRVISDKGIGQARIIAADNKALDSSDLLINQWDMWDCGINFNDLITSFIGYGALSILAQNGIVQNIIQSISTDSVREWGKLIYNGGGNEERKLKQIEARMGQLQVRDTFKIAMEKTWLFGGCMVYPKIAGDDEDRDKPLPLNPGSIAKGSLKYLKIIEPIYCSPMEFNASDPFAKAFYEPQTWNIMAQSAHHTRLMRFVANDAPLLLKPVYLFFGISPVQMALSKIQGFEQVYKEIVGIISKYNLNVLRTDSNALTEILNGSTDGSDMNNIKARLVLFNKLRTNFGTLLLDKDSEEWQQFNMSLTTLDKLLNQNLEIIAAYTRIPATKLFGTSPQGFGSTGSSESKSYHEMIRSVQISCMQPHIDHYIKMIQLDLFGEIDPDIGFTFNPLDVPSALEKSQIVVNKATAFTSLYTTGTMQPKDFLIAIAKDEDLGLDHIDTKRVYMPENNELDNDDQVNQ